MEISEAHAKELEKQERRKVALRGEVASALAGAGPILFEPGCGHGHWLTSYAEAHPEEICVGIDLISLRVRKAQAKRNRRELPKLHFFKAELSEFLEVLPEAVRFAKVVFLFPDPWPKKRHFRRRMIQMDTLSELAARTVPGGYLCFRTDDRPYFDWTVEHLSEHPDWTVDPEAPWPHESETYFQKLMDGYHSVVARRAVS